jgi:hypothetical protein
MLHCDMACMVSQALPRSCNAGFGLVCRGWFDKPSCAAPKSPMLRSQDPNRDRLARIGEQCLRAPSRRGAHRSGVLEGQRPQRCKENEDCSVSPSLKQWISVRYCSIEPSLCPRSWKQPPSPFPRTESRGSYHKRPNVLLRIPRYSWNKFWLSNGLSSFPFLNCSKWLCPHSQSSDSPVTSPSCPSIPPGTCQIGPPRHLVPKIAMADLNSLR